jgi:hypothetical protein
MELSNRQDLINALYDDETRESAAKELNAIIKTGERLIKMGMYNQEQINGLRSRFDMFSQEIAQAYAER